MIAGALNFTLGLQANQFLNALGGASGRLLAFTGIATSLSAALHKMWAAVEKGGALKDLAARSNISVAALYKLQAGFEDVGASAESVPTIINKLRRSLASGESDNLLSQMGFDPKALSQLDPAKQFEAIAAAMAKLSDNSRSAAATKIFGREGAMTIQQIASSGTDFATAMQRAAGDASIWNKVAGKFDSISDSTREIKGHMETAWAGFTGGIAPALENVTKKLAAIDLGGFGLRLGNEITLAFEAVNLGKFSQYFTLSLQAGIHEASNLMMNEIIKWGIAGEAAMHQSGEKGSGFWSKLGSGAAGVGVGLFGLWNVLGANLGIPGADAMADKRIALAQSLFDKAGIGDGILNQVAGAFTGGIAGNKNPFLEQLAQLRAEMQAAFKGRVVSPGGGGGGGGGLSLGFGGGAKTNNPSVTSIEKMGFIFNGRGSANSDYARSTAESTRQSARTLKDIYDKISTPGTSDFANQD